MVKVQAICSFLVRKELIACSLFFSEYSNLSLAAAFVKAGNNGGFCLWRTPQKRFFIMRRTKKCKQPSRLPSHVGENVPVQSFSRLRESGS